MMNIEGWFSALEDGNVQEVQEYLNQGWDPNVVMGHQITGLMRACFFGQLQCILEILPRSNVNAVDSDGWNAVHWLVSAVSSSWGINHEKALDILVKNNVDLDYKSDDGLTPRQVAVKMKNMTAAQRLEEIEKAKKEWKILSEHFYAQWNLSDGDQEEGKSKEKGTCRL